MEVKCLCDCTSQCEKGWRNFVSRFPKPVAILVPLPLGRFTSAAAAVPGCPAHHTGRSVSGLEEDVAQVAQGLAWMKSRTEKPRHLPRSGSGGRRPEQRLTYSFSKVVLFSALGKKDHVTTVGAKISPARKQVPLLNSCSLKLCEAYCTFHTLRGTFAFDSSPVEFNWHHWRNVNKAS